MARKKKPTVLKKLHGTMRSDRVLENEMQFENLHEIPECPDHLKRFEYAEGIWKECTEELHNLGMLHKSDLQLLQVYCLEMAKYWICQDQIYELDDYKNPIYPMRDKEGNVRQLIPVPYIRMATQHFVNAKSIAGQFGFTPSDRTRIAMPKGSANQDPLDALDQKYS